MHRANSHSIRRRHSRAAHELSPIERAGRLSVRELEDALQLPRGAWKSRRLLALRARTNRLQVSGIARGDILIVQPGLQAVPGRLVLVRSGVVLELRRARDNGSGRCVLAPSDPESLPLPVETGHRIIIGAVIGILTAARGERGELRSPQLKSLRPQSRVSDTQVLPAASLRVCRQRDQKRLAENIAMWDDWALRHLCNGAGSQAGIWFSLSTRLRTLAACMAATNEPPLYRALAQAAQAVLGLMLREATAVGTSLALRQIDCFPQLRHPTATDARLRNGFAGPHYPPTGVFPVRFHGVGLDREPSGVV